MSPQDTPKFSSYEIVMVTDLYDSGDDKRYDLKADFIRFTNGGKNAMVNIGGMRYIFDAWRIKKLDDKSRLSDSKR